MTVDLVLAPDTERLVADMRDWAVTEGRSIARAADRLHDVPAGATRILDTCPVDVSPLLGEDIGPGQGPRREFVGRDEDGSHVLGVAVVEQIAYGDMAVLTMLRGNGIGGRVVRILGTPDQVDRWAQGLARGTYRYAGFALTEPGCGSDAASLATTAVRHGDRWVLNGTKVFCSGGAFADYVVVFASIDRTLGDKGIRAFIVEAGTPGFTVTKANEVKLGVRGMLTSELTFDDVEVPLDHCLGDEGEQGGFRAALATLSTTRPLVAAMATGIGQAALDAARTHLLGRRSAFEPRRWARIETEFEHMEQGLMRGRLLALRAAWLMDQGRPHVREASAAKAYACPLAERVCLRALLLMGADGYSEEHLVEKWYRDVKIMDIWEGTGNIQRLVIARAQVKDGVA